jgi:hypothetical protein
MVEIPRWFPKDMEELYRPDLYDEPSIRDPRVVTSHGGGACPVQHWGVLTDGRVFYFRYRHGWAYVSLAPEWYEPGLLPARNPRTTHEEWDAAYATALAAANGVYDNIPDDALPSLWLVTGGGFVVTEENDGWFGSQEELDTAFTRCLDEAWDKPFDEEGWEALRQTNWRKDQNPWVKDDLDDL